MPKKKTDISFKAFWDAYGLKRDRYAAEPVWNRLSERDRRAALAGIRPYREECMRTGVAMMYGSRYLKHRRWEDEADPETDAALPDHGLFTPPVSPASDAQEDMETW